MQHYDEVRVLRVEPLFREAKTKMGETPCKRCNVLKKENYGI